MVLTCLILSGLLYWVARKMGYLSDRHLLLIILCGTYWAVAGVFFVGAFLAGLGGALFMVSDTLIATGVADWPQPPRPQLWIMLTYAAAQFLLVRGSLAERPGPVTAYREVRSTTP